MSRFQTLLCARYEVGAGFSSVRGAGKRRASIQRILEARQTENAFGEFGGKRVMCKYC